MVVVKVRLSPTRIPCRKLGRLGVNPQHLSGISPTLPSSGSIWSGQPGSSYLHSEGEEPEKGTTQVDRYQAGQGRNWIGNSSPNPTARVSRGLLRAANRSLDLIRPKAAQYQSLLSQLICKWLFLNKVLSRAIVEATSWDVRIYYSVVILNPHPPTPPPTPCPSIWDSSSPLRQ